MKLTVNRSRPEPHQRQRHRDHPHDGEGQDGEQEVRPGGVLEARNHHRRAEDQPHQQRQQPTALLGELDHPLEVTADDRSEGHPGDEGGDEAVAVRLDGGAVGEQGQAQGGEGAETRGTPPLALARASSQPPTSPTPAPTPAPTSSPPAALSTVVEWATSVLTAPARKRLTNGVAMPSLRPLSTFSSRRIRFGIRGSSMIVAPSAASVGATMAPTVAATQSEMPGITPKAAAVPEADGEREADGQKPDRQTQVRAELVDVDPGGIGEQHQGQRDLGQRLDRLGMGAEVDEGQWAVGDRPAPWRRRRWAR